MSSNLLTFYHPKVWNLPSPLTGQRRIPAIACFWSKLRSCWGGWLFLEIELCMCSKAVHTFTKKWYQNSVPKKRMLVKQRNDIFHLYKIPSLLLFKFWVPNLMPKGAITVPAIHQKITKIGSCASGCLLASSNQMVHWHHQSISIGRCQSPGVQKKTKQCQLWRSMDFCGFCLFCCGSRVAPKKKSICLPTPDLIKKGHPLLLQHGAKPTLQGRCFAPAPKNPEPQWANLLHCATFIGAITQGLAAFQPIQRRCGNNKQPISASTSTTSSSISSITLWQVSITIIMIVTMTMTITVTSIVKIWGKLQEHNECLDEQKIESW